MTDFADVPGTAAPLHNALIDAGYPTLESLDGVPYKTLIALHGVGKVGLGRIQDALRSQGLSLGEETKGATITAGHTGKSASDIKTHITSVDPVDYINGLDTPRRVEHGKQLLEMFNRITGAEPKMWGPSMIGYGEVHYVSHTGREGDWFQCGFSPAKSKISLYGLKDTPRGEQLLQKLGKYTEGKGCVYINKPEDIDLDVLEAMIQESWEDLQASEE